MTSQNDGDKERRIKRRDCDHKQFLRLATNLLNHFTVFTKVAKLIIRAPAFLRSTRPLYNQRYHQDRQVDQNSYPALIIQPLKAPIP